MNDRGDPIRRLASLRGIVCVLECCSEVIADVRDEIVGQALVSVRREKHVKVDAVDVLERHVRCALALAEIDDADDVAVPKLCGQTRLTLEELDEVFAVLIERKHEL